MSRRAFGPTWLAAGRDARNLAEVVVVVVATWIVLGWWFGEPLMRADGPQLWAPLHQSALAAGSDWTDHTYRFGVLGGSPMHVALGTTPVLQICAVLGFGATTTGNVEAIVIQVLVGYIGLVMVQALVRCWYPDAREMSRFERVVTVWCCAFSPALAWRIATGHENIMQGVLPWLAVIGLWWSARANTLSLTSLIVGWFAVFLGVASAGQQIMVYCAIFGMPILLVTIAGGPRGGRLQRGHIAVVLAVLAALLAAAPRLAAVVHHQLGDDVARGVGQSLFHSYGRSYVVDWIESIPWMMDSESWWPGALSSHETNYPIGPLILIPVLLWPRGVTRDLGLAAVVGALLAGAFSLDIAPITPAIRQIPLADSFRVPARALLPFVIVAPMIALASAWAALATTSVRRALFGRETAISLVSAAILLVSFRELPGVIRELAAWSSCIAIAVVLRRSRIGVRVDLIAALFATIAALNLAAFDERIRRVQPAERIEDRPQQVRRQVLARAPELAMPLARIQLPDWPQPFNKSMARAAGLSTLDGVWYPTRRFHTLLGLLWGKPLEPTEIDFQVTRRSAFDLLVQLYNVKYVLKVDGRFMRLPPTNGAAWFPAELSFVDDANQVLDELRVRGRDLRASLARTAWLIRSEVKDAPVSDPRCAEARVHDVATDGLGQTARVSVTVPTTCVLIVATNYASMLHATDGLRALRVVPVDVALTGVIVPPGTNDIVLGPAAYEPTWTLIMPVFSALALLAACALLAWRRRL